MIVIRKFKSSDFEDLNDLIGELNHKVKSPDSNELVYLSFEDEKLIGAIKAVEKDGLWFLNYVYVHKDYRNEKLADGLLRVIIDKLDKKAIKNLYFSDRNQYLIKRGFREASNNTLQLNVENFFKDKCSCGGQNEV